MKQIWAQHKPHATKIKEVALLACRARFFCNDSLGYAVGTWRVPLDIAQVDPCNQTNEKQESSIKQLMIVVESSCHNYCPVFHMLSCSRWWMTSPCANVLYLFFVYICIVPGATTSPKTNRDSGAIRNLKNTLWQLANTPLDCPSACSVVPAGAVTCWSCRVFFPVPGVCNNVCSFDDFHARSSPFDYFLEISIGSFSRTSQSFAMIRCW